MASDKETEAKAASFDAIWQVCVELGMKVHPPGVDEDGKQIDEPYVYQFKFLRGLKKKADLLNEAVEALQSCVNQLSPSPTYKLVILPGQQPYSIKVARELLAKIAEQKDGK